MKETWSNDLREEFGIDGKPMSRQVFEAWVRKAEATTGLKRVYRGEGRARRMYLSEAIVGALRAYHKMKRAKGTS